MRFGVFRIAFDEKAVKVTTFLEIVKGVGSSAFFTGKHVDFCPVRNDTKMRYAVIIAGHLVRPNRKSSEKYPWLFGNALCITVLIVPN